MMAEGKSLRESVVAALRDVYDPEIPVNIYDMGLVYEVNLADGGEVGIVMTLTSPMCPVAEWMPQDVDAKVSNVEGVSSVKVDVVWDPPWDPEMMSEAARLELGMF